MMKRILQWLHWPLRKRPQLDGHTREYLAYFDHLFGRTARTSGFEYLCTLLRVEGIKSGHWDAFVEAEDTASDFSDLLRKMDPRKQQKRSLRMGLFLYCHLTEMSAPYEILANMLRIIQGQPYSMSPFAHLVEKQSNYVFGKKRLPSPKKKIGYLRELATACGEEKLVNIIEGFFNNTIRNAFYHSDYAISDDEFRIAEGGEIGKQVFKLQDVSEMLAKCFAFYSAFSMTHSMVRERMARDKKFIRWPNYEVLELLSDDQRLTGFKIHFPNGSHAFFERKKYQGTMALNMGPREEGIELFVGDLQKYKQGDNWYVNGKVFEEYGTRYNDYGFWRPIVFHRDSNIILQKILKLTDDKTIQGLLFYIFATGHAAVEFALKSSRPLYKKEVLGKKFLMDKSGIELFPCQNPDGKGYIYDGTYYLKSKDIKDVAAALRAVNGFIGERQNGGLDIKHRLKYQIYNDGSEGTKEEHEDGSFSFTISMDDPRVTMVTNSLGIFPRSDWRIREGWI